MMAADIVPARYNLMWFSTGDGGWSPSGTIQHHLEVDVMLKEPLTVPEESVVIGDIKEDFLDVL